MVMFIMQLHGMTMTGINQLEMRLHEKAEQIGQLQHQVKTLTDEVALLKATMENLRKCLMVQG